MDDIDYKMIGQRMQKLRKEQGITQEQIAEKLEVTVSFISNIENSRSKINLKILRLYALMLNVSIDYLLQTNTGSQKVSIQDEEISRLLKLYTPQEKEKLIHILRYLKEPSK